MAAQFQFVMRSGPNTGEIYPLGTPEIIVGREASNGVAINDGEVSRKHAKLSLQGSTYVIQDLGSTNGTFINGKRISTPQVLNPGDAVSFGENIVLVYEAAFDPNATLVASSQASKTVVPASSPVPTPVRTPAPTPTPTPTPAPIPAQVPSPVSTPVQGYSGQVPVSPVPMAVAPVKKGGGKVIVIILIMLLLCLILACVAIFFWVDSDKSGARWCMVPFKWIVNLIDPLVGFGTCP